MQYLGIDWGTRRAAWCAIGPGGELTEGAISADEDGLVRLVSRLGSEVHGCIEMMSGAPWVRDSLATCGWTIQIADARKVKAIAPLACKTDRVDARVLADLARRDLVPELWVAPLDDRAIRERLRRRSHLIRLRTSSMNRTFGLLTQWGLRRSAFRAAPARRGRRARRTRRPTGLARLAHRPAGRDRRPRPPDRAAGRRTAPARPRRRTRPAADDHPGRRRTARADDRVRNRRHRALPQPGQARRLLRD